MPLSLAELRHRATAFALEYAGTASERAESQSFWRDFLDVFGQNRRRVAQFEVPVKKADGAQGFIDMFIPGKLLVEQKTLGRDLSKATAQARDYFPGLPDYKLPRYVLVSDFARFRLHDLDTGLETGFALAELPEHLHLFGFLSGYQSHATAPDDPANAEAAELMARLHDALLEGGYRGHALEVLLVRLLFCLFAEDTAILEADEFRAFLENHTAEDGSDLGPRLAHFFATLDQAPDQRPRALPAYLANLPYVNGALFREDFRFPAFDAATRAQLIRCTYFDWSRISPAVFGSLFQSIADPARRRTLGAHYTSEQNILKVIGPLFLDDLRQELAAAGSRRGPLDALHRRLETIRFLDPSCGCGNFLVVTYRELRLLEHQVLARLFAPQLATGQTVDLALYTRVQVDQAHGIELEEFAARIAEVAMWLMDHQLNLQLSATFGNRYVRLPLVRTARIEIGNALQVDWESVAPKATLSYILGNPPFVGSKLMSADQRRDLLGVAGAKLPGAGVLDYVAGWYLKAARFMQGTAIRAAFVSTNSITQGEQVSILWGEMLHRYGMRIQFAHRTFKWNNEARGTAAVFCVIVGFGAQPVPARLFDYATPRSEPQELKVSNINPYLVDGENVLVASRNRPLSPVPAMVSGNKPIDDGNYLFTPARKEEFLQKEPQAAPYFKRWLGGEEFINGTERWCLWLGDISPVELAKMPEAKKLIEAVRVYRSKSKSAPTQKLAFLPTRFHVEFIPDKPYLAIPEVSSERRRYIPIGFLDTDVIASNKLRLIPEATPFLFGILTSTMHMAWMRQVCGRLKSDYNYSAGIVYNNFPFPPTPTAKQQAAVEAAAGRVLAARAQFAGATLALLYDPLTMPPALAQAHAQLDRAVDSCYRPAAFPTELSRLEFLFTLYRQLAEPLLPAPKAARARRVG
ncbi:class I SAM-dependent DNA methyltransferase [Hymenobacter psoromatis]|uniref:class I SAM-dependent DNA methyltransferase n=1 Tax=Hymenobacter psoromatis TaxID=1484116 RepID=UPI001CBDD663|nr:DNA methyltransferase [Hymenobacter psoromatis]